MFTGTMDIPKNKVLVGVSTTNNRGFTPEELAAQCVEKIISISDTSHPGIRDQAHAFAKSIEKLLAQYMQQAILSDRTNVYNTLNDAGHPELAELIRRL
jgi:hypothetical protein